MQLIVTRPQPDADRLAARLHTLGHDALVAPLLQIVPIAGVNLPSRDHQATIVTSANALRVLEQTALSPDIKSRPLLAVGPASACLARKSGFADVRDASGDLYALVELATVQLSADRGPLLYLCGKVRSGDLAAELTKHGFLVDRVELYDATPSTELPDAVVEAIEHNACDGVLLYSARTARTWCEHIASANLVDKTRPLVHFCLSNKVADIVKRQFNRDVSVVVAQRPDETAMMQLIRAGASGGLR